MDWPIVLLFFFGGLTLLMLTGMPLAFAFLLEDIISAWFIWGGEIGLRHITVAMQSGLSSFTLMPMALFILMGEVLFYTGIGRNIIEALDKFIGRFPGRLGFLAVGAGTLLGTLTGSSMGSVAILGSTLVPDMKKRGYSTSMCLGPVLGSGGLAIMIPPSSSAVLLASIAEVSVGAVLMGIIVPGILLAVFYSIYIIVRCLLQPSIAPSYDVTKVPLKDKVMSFIKYILPIGIVIFLVIGTILLGIATPTEAAATGVAGTYFLAILYGKFNWNSFKKSLMKTVEISAMIYLILEAALIFSQILSFSGATRGLASFILSLQVSPMVIFILIQLLGLVLGMFMTIVGIVMIIIPLFMPVITALGINEVWFCVVLLLNCEMAVTTPPFGAALFAMKSVVPKDITMAQIYSAGLPYLGCDLVALILLILFPAIVLWLPGMMF